MPIKFGWSDTFTLVTRKYEMMSMSFHFSLTQNTSKKTQKKKKKKLTTTVWGTLSILHTYQLRIKEKSGPIKKNTVHKMLNQRAQKLKKNKKIKQNKTPYMLRCTAPRSPAHMESYYI